jgi:hypothetical protein
LTYTLNREFERESMGFVRFALEMEGLDKMARINIDVLFRNALRNKCDVFGDARNAVFRTHLLIHLIVVDPIDSDGTCSLLVI